MIPMTDFDMGMFDIIERPAYEDMAETKKEEENISALMNIMDALEALGVTLIEEVKSDGLQVGDLFKVPLDKDLRSKVVDAFQSANEIPAEVEDLSREERRALIHRAIDLAHNIEEALTGDSSDS